MADRLNKPKNKIAQLFCKHDGVWCKRQSLYMNLSGETQYKVCKKCGKTIDKVFYRYD